MPVEIDRLTNLSVYGRVRAYSRRDARLYALSVGFGTDPLDEAELDFVSDRVGFKSVPTMATIFADVIMELGIACELDRPELAVHGEQKLEFFSPLPDAAELEIRGSITGVYDRGPERGAELHMLAEASFRGETDPVYRATYVTVARGDGGFDGPPPAHDAPDYIPDLPPDSVRVAAVPANAALLYSLNGDPNPIHTQPELARRAGFDAPILHGLCTYGMACRAVLAEFCNYDPASMHSFDVRFSAPVYPGESVAFEMWRVESGIAFQARTKESNRMVLKNGFARVTTA